jgi:hypothetical protein
VFTVAIPFTRSMRALHADSHLSTLVNLTIALVLLFVWTAWFFLAQIALSTTGQIVTITRTGAIIAAFPATAQGTLRRGQQARVHLQGNIAALRKPLSAVVAEVRQPIREDRVQAELYVREDATIRQLLQQGMQGEVEVTVARVSPATLVMRHLTAP